MSCAILFIGGTPFAWRMGRLTQTTLSATEAEWFAQTTGAAKAQALDSVFTFLRLNVTRPIISFCDNISAIYIAEASLTTKRLKHVITRMAYLQERIDEKLITLIHMKTDGMLADIGTKVLMPTTFHRLREMLVWSA